MEMNKKMLGQRLREAREKRGLTAAQAARRSEMPNHQLLAYEKGRVLPRLDTLMRLATVLEADITEILSDALDG